MSSRGETDIRSRLGKIGVLAGGPSSEREISLKSGKAVYDALIEEGLEAVFLDVRNDVMAAVSLHKVDIAFIALHGRFGEDGTVQRLLETAGIPYTGSGEAASRLALDKIASKEIFIRSGIPTPRYRTFRKGESSVKEVCSFGFPMVIKPQFEGSSIGLSIVNGRNDLDEALEKAFRLGDRILAEELIEGRELTVGVLEEKALPVIEIVAKNKVYDFTAKYNDPDTRYLVPAPIDDDVAGMIKGMGIRSHEALGCRAFSRTDIILDKLGNAFVLEVNTIPGLTERSLLPKAARAAGLSFNQLCIKLIENAYEEAKKI